MTQRKYQHYQAVEGGWFAQIPKHWEMLSSNRVFEQKREPAAADDEQLSVTQKYGVMPQNLFMAMDDRKVTLALAGTDNFKHVDEGDFVISLRSFEGGIELSRYKGCISPAYTCLRARKPIGEGYYKFTMKSKDFISALQSVTQGIRDGKNISYAEFSKLSIPYPPVEEQTAIDTFLDRETAKIDALITEQQRLIELLQEKRQAVISHAVTKGLNPNAPMKDSGVEWLGEVPEHWEVNKLSRMLLQAPCYGVLVPDYEEGGIPMIRINDLGEGTINPGVRCIKESQSREYSRTLIEAGDVLMGVVGTIGRPVVADSRHESWNLSRAVARLVTRKNALLPNFLALLLESDILSCYKDLVCTGTAQIVLNMQDLSALRICIPSLDEQEEILRLTTTRIEELRETARLASAIIDLLSERRSALISAAVTGQIDVRGLAEAEEQVA